MKKRCAIFSLLILITPAFAQQRKAGPPIMNVQHYEIKAEVVPERSFLEGEVKIRFVVLENSLSLPFELNSRMSLLEVFDEENTQYSLSYDDFESSRMRIRGTEPFPRGTEKTLTFRFEGTLETEEYAFLDTPSTERAMVGPQGALLLGEGKWFPSYALPLDAASVRVEITVPLGFTVVGPGTLDSIDTVGVSEIFTWKSDPPVTHIPVVVARFFRQKFEDSGVPLTFFVTEEFNRDLRPLADEVDQILEFFQSEFGPFPHSAINFVHVSDVKLPSTGSAGLILLESAVLESPSLPIMELAKRLARQWWGYSLRFERSADAWLQDGFATYAALRYVEVKHSERFSTELAREAVAALKYQSKAPISQGLELEMGSAEYESIVGSKGAWILYMLSQLVGRDKLNSDLGEWYRRKARQVATTDELIDFVQERTGEDYRWFFVQWVDSVGIPEFRIDYTIYKLQDGSFKIRGQIRQDIELFRMPVDVLIETKGQSEEKRLNVSGKTTSFTFETETMPLRMELDPHGKILRDSQRMRVAVHVALGEEYQASGEFVSAIREYEKASQLNPRSSLAHFRLGEVFFEQQNLSTAANSFRDTLNGDLKPEWVETWTHIYLGKIYDILGQRQRALAEYQKAINIQIDYNGAQAEAQKYLQKPFTKPQSIIG
ncbi:tetratricopeptide repeat protein [Acidobacteria bacterium AH-259-D05]|nr:tetratricopeptide repeat protein [Acidobacteria bacterium AH-259-D05]